ncbi:hypothetical protein V4F39_01880, partial [Aquincola sp. MAHUQ-54]
SSRTDTIPTALVRPRSTSDSKQLASANSGALQNDRIEKDEQVGCVDRNDDGSPKLVQCAALFCTYPAAATKAALARVTLARMSVALAVQMNYIVVRLVGMAHSK